MSYEVPTRALPALCELFLQDVQPVVLLGAGASFPSVPTAAQLTRRIAERRFRSEYGFPSDVAVDPDQLRAFLARHAWYRPEEDEADQYPAFVRNFLTPQVTRRDFLRAEMTGKIPNAGHLAFARLAQAKAVRIFLTTNFDDLLYDALNETAGTRAVRFDTPQGFGSFNSSDPEPKVVYLHGSVDFYMDRNTDEEVRSLDDAFLEKLPHVLDEHPLVVIGYRGAEPSVMERLLIGRAKAAGNYKRGIWWCRFRKEPLHRHVEDLARLLGGNFNLVDIEGFEQVASAIEATHKALRTPAQEPRRTPPLRPPLVEPDLPDVGVPDAFDVNGEPAREPGPSRMGRDIATILATGGALGAAQAALAFVLASRLDAGRAADVLLWHVGTLTGTGLVVAVGLGLFAGPMQGATLTIAWGVAVSWMLPACALSSRLGQDAYPGWMVAAFLGTAAGLFRALVAAAPGAVEWRWLPLGHGLAVAGAGALVGALVEPGLGGAWQGGVFAAGCHTLSGWFVLTLRRAGIAG